MQSIITANVIYPTANSSTHMLRRLRRLSMNKSTRAKQKHSENLHKTQITKQN